MLHAISWWVGGSFVVVLIENEFQFADLTDKGGS
jgi:hypothetical protein